MRHAVQTKCVVRETSVSDLAKQLNIVTLLAKLYYAPFSEGDTTVQ